MGNIIISCITIEDEVKKAMERVGLEAPVYWLEGGLHNTPDRLRERLQGLLNDADGQCERVIFTLGHCGGGVNNLSTGNYETVIPLADDCISILLGSMNARREASRPTTYFLTRGWMRHENNIVAAYADAIVKYGQAKADRLNKLMLNSYARFGLVQTGTYDLREAAAEVEPLATAMDMRIEDLPGQTQWLDGLFTGPYDDSERFVVLPPHSKLEFDHWQKLLR